MILTRLKDETRPLHVAVEGRLDLLAPALTRDQYARTLGRFLGFYAPLEDRLGRVAGYDTVGLNVTERRKAHLLAADLAALGTAPAAVAAVPRSPDVPTPDDLSAALGCLYVLEGATLGGQIIRRHVHSALGLGPESGCSFFGCYGDRTGAMWRAFGAAVTAHATTPDREDAVVRAACDTFAALDRWLAPGGW